MNGGKSCLRHLLRKGSDATEMSGIADSHRANAGLPGLGDSAVHGLTTDHLSIAELPVNDCIARRFPDNNGVLVGDHHAFGVPIDVLRQANDAMRFVAGQI